MDETETTALVSVRGILERWRPAGGFTSCQHSRSKPALQQARVAQ